MRGIGDENYPCTSRNSPGEVLVDLLFPTSYTDPLHRNVGIVILCSLYISSSTHKENLLENQELPKSMIISSVLVASTFVSEMIL